MFDKIRGAFIFTAKTSSILDKSIPSASIPFRGTKSFAALLIKKSGKILLFFIIFKNECISPTSDKLHLIYF